MRGQKRKRGEGEALVRLDPISVWGGLKVSDANDYL